MLNFLDQQFQAGGFGPETAALSAGVTMLVLVIVLSILTNVLAKRLLLTALFRLVVKTKTDWDDHLLKHHFFDRLARFAPALVIYLMVPVALESQDRLIALLTTVALIYMIVIGILAIDALLNGVSEIYQSSEVSKEIPIKVFVQLIKVAVYFIGGIFVVSLLLGKTPLYLVSGLSALTAILMLIFKDAILGFVAGIQLTANKMVTQGDWIEMPNYGADGDVVEVGLTTVKVQNWDKTITTIPTYALISGSFKNWRGMTESGGRRIKRAIHVDMNSIQFCTEDMLTRYKRIQCISAYIEAKGKELPEYNRANRVDELSLVNGRKMTNIGTFRAYIVAYLKNHPMIHTNMTSLVRQLAPTEHGLPIEIYVFCKDIAWANYEAIQADIFDHLLAAIPEFDLKLFQNPTGSDFKAMAATKTD